MAETRQRILTAAQELFAARGPACDIAAIAAKAKVNPVTVHRLFKHKEELYRVAFEERITASNFVRIVIEPVEAAPRERKLEVLVDVLEQYYTRHHDMLRFMFYTALENPKLLERVWNGRPLLSVGRLHAQFPDADVAQAAMWAVLGRHVGIVFFKYQRRPLHHHVFRNPNH